MIDAKLILLEAFLRMAPCVILFLITFHHHSRISKHHIKSVLVVFMLLTVIPPAICLTFFHTESWVPLYTLFYFICVIAFCIYAVDFSFYRVLLVFFIIGNYMDSIELIKDTIGSSYLSSLVNQWGYFPTSALLRAGITILTLPVMIYFCIKFLRPIIDQPKSSPFYKYLWLVPIAFFVIYRISINPQDNAKLQYFFNEVTWSKMIIWILGLTLNFVIILRMLKETIDKQLLEQAVERSAMAERIQKKMYENLILQIQESRQKRQDFHHQMLLMKQYCEQQQYEALTTYLQQYIGSFSLENQTIFCDNVMINRIMQYYGKLAQEQNISCDFHLKIPKTYDVEEPDLCSLLSNAIENAIEACARQKHTDRWITMRSEYFGSTFTLLIENSYEGILKKSKHGLFYSSKRNEEGIGISSIRQICDKYDGICEISYDEEKFQLRVMLLQKQKNAKVRFSQG